MAILIIIESEIQLIENCQIMMIIIKVHLNLRLMNLMRDLCLS